MNNTYLRIVLLFTIATMLMAPIAAGQTPLQIGSPNTATADPPQARPNTTPCVVQLFSNLGPVNANANLFSFAPPAGCPPPWAKVIISADFSVPPGRGGDRTTTIFIGATNVLYNTSPLPLVNLGQTWHVERDLTDYSQLLSTPHAGQVTVSTNARSAVITESVSILFFPTSSSAPARVTPDVLLPLSLDPVLGGQVSVTAADTLSRTFTMPTNVQRAFVDLIARALPDDEFYYACVPDATIAAQLLTCSGTPFREAEITVDGKPAGVVPMFPRLTEGGIDPRMWLPIPALTALNLLPYRVDITPFAGLLSNGTPHEIGIRVADAVAFNLNGAVLLFLDHGSSHVTGGLVLDTLGDPNPVSSQSVSTSDGTTTGTFTVRSARSFRIKGFVNTSHGRVDTEVAQHVELENLQTVRIAGPAFDQSVKQRSTVRSSTTITGPDGERRGDDARTTISQEVEFPLDLQLRSTFNPDGSLTQTATVAQQSNRSTAARRGDHDDDGRSSFEVTRTSVNSQDTVFFSPSFAVVGNQGQLSSQSYFTKSSEGGCFSRQISAANALLASVKDGKGCRRDDDDDERDGRDE